MKKITLPFAVSVVLTLSIAVEAKCPDFGASTLFANGVQPTSWRTDYPKILNDIDAPWLEIEFDKNPVEYMRTVLDSARNDFSRSNNRKRLMGKDSSQWWISLWLDYTNSGREPLMGLTKERGPDGGDLSETNVDGYQVWAVGFYNAPGAFVLGQIFTNPCDPDFPETVNFPEGTASIKFLFTDASPREVTYLKGAPEFEAFIDEEGTGSMGLPAKKRIRRTVRLLQVDIATKDKDAKKNNWVFGTFAWIKPSRGDELFDNLVPVSLQWGNDEEIYNDGISESWVNDELKEILYGWSSRPHLGFKGRANGPADNIRSSCLSCHAAARITRSEKGILGAAFDMENYSVPEEVKKHVDTWFVNLPSGAFFDPNSSKPKVSALDYSLQLDAAVWRMCRACKDGALTGKTPNICLAAEFVERNECGQLARTKSIGPKHEGLTAYRPSMESRDPPRQ